MSSNRAVLGIFVGASNLLEFEQTNEVMSDKEEHLHHNSIGLFISPTRFDALTIGNFGYIYKTCMFIVIQYSRVPVCHVYMTLLVIV